MKYFKKYGPIAGLVLLIYLLMRPKNSKKMPWPLKNIIITSPFGYRTHPVTGEKRSFHNGVDLKAALNTGIYAPFDGVVKNIYINFAGGLQLIIEHTNGYTTGYAHLNSTNNLIIGSQVKKGQLIGYTGSSGQVTGPHLHYTITDTLTNIKLDPQQISYEF
jgi:murein DD-endopeptidase MepM/ murein hydrolase activator NlpD